MKPTAHDVYGPQPWTKLVLTLSKQCSQDADLDQRILIQPYSNEVQIKDFTCINYYRLLIISNIDSLIQIKIYSVRVASCHSYKKT